MKLKLPEHDHKLTNLLKVILFSILMLLPFLDTGTRCGYVLLNKNAYQSYNGYTGIHTEYESISSFNELVDGGRYRFNLKNNVTTANIDVYLYFSDIEIITTTLNATYQQNLLNSSNFHIWYDTNLQANYFSSNNLQTNIGALNNVLIFDFTFLRYTSLVTTNNEFNYYFGNMVTQTVITTSNTTLDNVFDYSINKMAESPLYNWTQSTGMYTGVNAMTSGLGITTPLFAMLITYWLFLTIIYIILDIVLTLFTFMTHIFTSKKD